MTTPGGDPQTPLRIAIISPYAHHPGHHWGTARDLAQALRAKGHQVEIVTTTHPIEAIDPLLAPCVFPVWSGNLPRVFQSGHSLGHNLETLACTLGALWRHRQRPYNVWQYVDATHLILFLTALCVDAAVIYHLWGDVSGYEAPGEDRASGWPLRPSLRSLLARWALRRGRLAMVCETEETRRSASLLFPNHVYQIPYAVREKVVPQERSSARKALGIAPGKFVLLMFGTHRADKDYETVVQGAKRASGEVYLLFAGKTISANDPAEIIARHRYENARVVEKFISAEEAPLYFAACDAVVLPYAGNYTKGSYVLFEAFQYGRPTLVADTGFLRSFVQENQCGFVFRPGDPEDFARVVTRLANLSESQKSVLSANLALTADRYSWSTVIERYVALYRRYL